MRHPRGNFWNTDPPETSLEIETRSSKEFAFGGLDCCAELGIKDKVSHMLSKHSAFTLHPHPQREGEPAQRPGTDVRGLSQLLPPAPSGTNGLTLNLEPVLARLVDQ